MKRLLMVLFMLVWLLPGQEGPDSVPYFASVRENTSTTAESMAIRVAASSSTRTYPLVAIVYCSLGCELTQKLDAVVTGTAVTPVAISTRGATSAAAVLHTVTPTGGSALPTLTIPAGGAYPIDLSKMLLPAGDSTARSYYLAAAGSSQTIRLAIFHWQR